MKRIILCALVILSISVLVTSSSSFLAEIVELADSYKGGSSGGGGRGGGGGGRSSGGGSRGGGSSRGGSSRGGSSRGGGSRGGRSSSSSGKGGRNSGRNSGRSTSGKSGRTSGKTSSAKSSKVGGRLSGRTRAAGLKAAQARASLSKIGKSLAASFSKVSPTLSKAFTGLVGPNMAKALSAMTKAAAASVKGPRVNALTARFNAAFAAQPAVAGKLTAAAIQASVQKQQAAVAQQPSVASYKIDKGLLTKNEAFSTKGYVPNAGKSGVTVGTGFDVGQQSVKGLKSLGLSPSLVDKLSPYTGLKQQAAKNYLSKNPLSLTAAEAKAIDKAVMDKSVASLAKDYEAAAAKNPKAVQKFTDLPASVQTVAYSVQHQYGSIKKATPNFFGKLTANDYKGMVHELRNFNDAYSTRRNREADHLEGGLKGASG